ncbi:hypothetical protein [Mycobacterium gastri]|uniref:Uncharacterized protein n=1 Tax=Mycobacterium gastri TaxID=1777 RepID=A0A1X1W2J5_MYCGS|nr:hypothetical protein [Mycobacterium gastri]ETW23078.1 hypothetical protein MGAST_16200 [Mycobacterium gastri 'Wayne']ORV80771.1 hypothetical protein AWC07_00015 [Mycobacterium gastri]
MTADPFPFPAPGVPAIPPNSSGVPIKVTPETLQQALYGPLSPQVVPNIVPPPGPAPADQAQSALGASGNLGVPGDVASSAQEDLDRRAHAADAARKFPANEANAAQQFQGVGAQAGAQGATQMIQQVVSGITGAVGGAVGGVLGPLTQLPQQAMQAGQGAMQPLMSALQQGHGAQGLESADGARLVDSIGEESGLGGGSGAGGIGGGGGGGTTPTGYLGPPPVPTSSPPTTPAGAAAKSVVPPSGGMAPTSASMGPTGMPMVPPGAMGHGGEGGSKDKPVEKRVSAPVVPNGQPVKGRLTMPPSVPVKSDDGKPPVVTRSTRRIMVVPADDETKE